MLEVLTEAIIIQAEVEVHQLVEPEVVTDLTVVQEQQMLLMVQVMFGQVVAEVVDILALAAMVEAAAVEAVR
jgi:hypothetical protein